jgi:hypothetical protein
LTGWLLDTNVVSELRKPRCNPHVRRWFDSRDESDLYVSRVTIAEIRHGTERATDEGFRRELLAWLDDTLMTWFEARILDLDEPVIVEWMCMVERGKRVNRTFSQPDLFLAATASVHGLVVATRNIGDFVDAGVTVLNPWTAAP